ncbi:MAG TPA: outer membrane lipoprotein-sorting protein, partial [Burkholderiaceae bacterium]|nr:outer membrane lipoprotein-sorting protein [Burkholderiaceae bacterium]
EAVEGHDAYKLKLTMKSGKVQHVWIDTQTFLDVKIDGIPRRMDGRMHNVYVYQRDFRSVQGLMMPFVLETAVDGYPDTHKMLIEKIAVNPKLDDARFTKPHA